MAKKKRVPKPNPVYELPRPRFRILAMDPGSRNFGISCVEVQGNKPVVLANAALMHPLNTLVDYRPARDLFLKEIARWVSLFKPQALIAERFQTRGNGGPLIELVSVMLGLLNGTYPELPFKFITASTWKNAFNRRHQVDLKDLYTQLRMPAHSFDATLIGIYGLELGFKRQLTYTPQRLMKEVERTYLLKLKAKCK